MNRVGLKHRLFVQAGLVAAFAFTAAAPAYGSERYAAFVIDAQTHEVLHEEAADEARYPASLTKMMTLYMLFDEMEKGHIKLSDKMKVSKKASRAAPTKLGLKAGGTITVESAIKALVTKSANDAAIVIAERLGGSESNFAANMTVKARKIGMSNTAFYNASGLPDMRQKTTARDMAVLSEKLIQDFPQYYHYFQTPGMQWGKRYASNHNRLLGNVEGVDGIKTGYTNASGYNLASAVMRDGRRVIAVVLGGETAQSRDNQMAYLIENAYLTLNKRGPASSTATLATLPLTKATPNFTTGTLAASTAITDQIQYSSPAPSGAAAASGSALGVALGSKSSGAPLDTSPGQQMIEQFSESTGLF
jgi:D-alanyl-D-alanine carboxypeptidase